MVVRQPPFETEESFFFTKLFWLLLLQTSFSHMTQGSSWSPEDSIIKPHDGLQHNSSVPTCHLVCIMGRTCTRGLGKPSTDRNHNWRFYHGSWYQTFTAPFQVSRLATTVNQQAQHQDPKTSLANKQGFDFIQPRILRRPFLAGLTEQICSYLN